MYDTVKCTTEFVGNPTNSTASLANIYTVNDYVHTVPLAEDKTSGTYLSTVDKLQDVKAVGSGTSDW